MNTVWSFARLDYSPDPDRELWAIAPSRPAARWTPPVRDGGSWGWEGQQGEAAADSSAVVREEERWLTTQEQRARAQERAVQNLAERVAAQRARREAYNRLLAYAREAVTTALARTPAARKDEKAERPVRVRYPGTIGWRQRLQRARVDASGGDLGACRIRTTPAAQLLTAVFRPGLHADGA